jgi:uncharacterized protein YutE (UPF0331/DUF86 family)
MVRKEVLRRRLNKLEEYIGILKRLQKYNFHEFIADPEHYGSAERFLHLGIEAVIDMGNHVIADLNLGVVNWYSDIPAILANKNYVTPDLADSWIKMIGFRNMLVHEYMEIDRKIVYDILNYEINDLERLKKVFAQFL